MTVLKIQPGPADGYDTWIDEANPNTNYYTDVYLEVMSLSPVQRQAFINFFFGDLPANSLVTKAELYVYCVTQTGCQDLHCYKASFVWYQDEVTWNLRPPVATPKRTEQATAGQWIKFDVLDIVQGWLTTPSSNLGFQLLSALCEDSLIRLYSADYVPDPTKRPYLELTYVPNGAQPCWPAPHAYTHIETGDDPIDKATPAIDGLMSATDKAKLDSIQTPPYRFMPRSLPTVDDFNQANFTHDGVWHVDGLDVSGIVPVNAVAVLFLLRFYNTSAGKVFDIRQDSGKGPYASFQGVASVWNGHLEWLIPCNSDRKFDYASELTGTNGTTRFALINVIGWCIP